MRKHRLYSETSSHSHSSYASRTKKTSFYGASDFYFSPDSEIKACLAAESDDEFKTQDLDF